MSPGMLRRDLSRRFIIIIFFKLGTDSSVRAVRGWQAVM